MHARELFRLTIVTATLLVADRTLAADFRVLDFTASCDDVTTLELARGSTEFQGRLPSGFQFAFNAREMDRDAVIGYACRDGRFFRGAYIFPVKDEAEATDFYTKLKKLVTADFGAPSFDFASKAYRQKMQSIGATLSRADTQVAFWDAGKSEAHASVSVPPSSALPPKPGEEISAGWRVSLSYTVKE